MDIKPNNSIDNSAEDEGVCHIWMWILVVRGSICDLGSNGSIIDSMHGFHEYYCPYVSL